MEEHQVRWANHMLSSGFRLEGTVAAQAAAHTAEVESDKAHLVPFLAPQGSQEAADRMQWPPAQGNLERAAS